MKFLILTSLFIFSGIGFSQVNDQPIPGEALFAAQEYEEDNYDPDFKIVFSTDEDLEDFKKLRTYYRDKANLKASLQSMLRDYKASDTAKLNSQLQWTKTQLDYMNGPSSTFHLEFKGASGMITYDWKEDIINEDFINNIIIPALEGSKAYIKRVIEANETFRANIKLINEDIQDCQDQIDIALAPEYKNQEFRARISFYFTMMIGVLLLGFFSIIAFKSDKTIGREFLGESGLQFVTMFVIIIAVILFGILGILEGKELTAILSGVSGYILGKGAQKLPKAKAAPEEPAPVDNVPAYDPSNDLPADSAEDFNFDDSGNDSGAVG